MVTDIFFNKYMYMYVHACILYFLNHTQGNIYIVFLGDIYSFGKQVDIDGVHPWSLRSMHILKKLVLHFTEGYYQTAICMDKRS